MKATEGILELGDCDHGDVNGQVCNDARDLARTIGGFAPGIAVKPQCPHKGQDKTVTP